MITGAHSLILSKDPEADRAFLKDVLKLPRGRRRRLAHLRPAPFGSGGASVRDEQPRALSHVRGREEIRGRDEEGWLELQRGSERGLGARDEPDVAGGRDAGCVPTTARA